MPQTAATKALVSDANYEEKVSRIEAIMQKGSGNLLPKEVKELDALADAVDAYERERWPVKSPTSLEGILELKMYELRLKQKELAAKLEVSDAKLSLIMSGKQKPDVQFLKRVWMELRVDAGVLLGAV